MAYKGIQTLFCCFTLSFVILRSYKIIETKKKREVRVDVSNFFKVLKKDSSNKYIESKGQADYQF